MNVLLTGGAGYIGSHIAVELLDCGYDVTIADNYSNSSPDIIGKIETITGKNARAYELDMTDTVEVDRMFCESRPDAVIHLAGLKAVGESVREPLRYYRNNIDCALTLIEAMQKHEVRQLIFSSSATVYNAAERLPYAEDMKTGGCSNPYGSTKHMIEQIITDATEACRLSTVILRYFNPVGAHASGRIGESPRGIPNNLMPYIVQVSAGILPELIVFGNDYPTKDGTCIRDYIHVVDLAKGHVDALRYSGEHTGAETINLGTGRGTSVLELVEAFEHVNGVSIPKKIGPRRAGDLPVVYADVSKAERIMGWKAGLSIAEMCRDSYAYAYASSRS